MITWISKLKELNYIWNKTVFLLESIFNGLLTSNLNSILFLACRVHVFEICEIVFYFNLLYQHASNDNIGHTAWLNLKATNLIIVKTLKLFLHWLKWRLLRYHSFLLLCRWSNCVYKWRKNFLFIKTEVPRHDWMVSYVGNVSYSGVRFILGSDYWRNGIKGYNEI